MEEEISSQSSDSAIAVASQKINETLDVADTQAEKIEETRLIESEIND